MSELEILRNTLAADRAGMIELERILSSVPAIAPESGGAGENEKCAVLERWLVGAGFSERQMERFDAPDKRVPSGVRPNLVLTIPGKSDDYAVWVMAHLDVVPPGDLKFWESDPFSVQYDEATDRLIGRGVEDNQQGLVSGVFAALALLKNNIVPRHTVKLLFMADEEFGSEYGAKFLLKNHPEIFRKDDLILIPDGGDPEGRTIEIAEKNILWLRVHTVGEQSHGSMPDKGKNAHLAACDLALRLNDLENFFAAKDDLFSPNYSTFQPTKKEGNVETVNIIPGDDVLYMDCRILPQYSLDMVRAEVMRRVSEIERKYSVRIEVTEPQRQQSPATRADAPVVRKLALAIKKTRGIDARPIGIGGGTVGAEFRCRGYDAAVWSTLDGVCHQPNEYCYVRNIIADAETLCAFFIEP